MVVSPVSLYTSDDEMPSTPDAGPRGFVTINHTSSNGLTINHTSSKGLTINHTSSNESSTSSALSSPMDLSRRESEHAPQTQGGMYKKSESHEFHGHKRRHSGSDEAGSYAEQSPYEYSPSGNPGPQHFANRALQVLRTDDHNPAQYYQNSVEQSGHAWQPDRSVQPYAPANSSRSSAPETQMADDLHRDSNDREPQSRSWDTTNGQVNHDPYGQDAASVASVAPKRKRNFSNRTKTGCLTCRKRKKKCDEGHPTCNNCARGGFKCQGYSVTRREPPTNPAPVKGPIPLQSKDGHGDVSQPSTYQGPALDTTKTNLPPPHHGGDQTRPIVMDDNERHHEPPYGASPHGIEPQSRPPYHGQPQWPPQQSVTSYSTEHLPPLHNHHRAEPPPTGQPQNMSRPPAQGPSYPPQHHQQPPPPPPQQQQQPPTPQQPPPPPAATHQGPPPGQPYAPLHPAPPHAAHLPAGQKVTHQPSSHPPPPQNQWHQPQPPPPPQPQPQPQPQNYQSSYVAPSSSHPTTSSHSRGGSSKFTIAGQEDVAKSQMLRSAPYNHLDATLTYERQVCDESLERFNRACKLSSGLKEEEVRNMFLKVLDPTLDTSRKFPSTNRVKGHLGLGVKIEPPFNCTYGYNVNIQDDVYIGKGCTFDDSGHIEVGPRAIIGPGVTILTTDYGKDVVQRRGTKGEWIAKRVIIGCGVIIGANAIIYPGVSLEANATIEPGAIVRESVRENQIYRAPAPISEHMMY